MAATSTHGRVGAGEDELAQAGFFDGDIENIAHAFHVGAKQRRRVAQPRASVDDAVVHVIDTIHCLAHCVGVEHVTVEPGELQVVDRAGVGGGAHHRAHFCASGDQLAGHM